MVVNSDLRGDEPSACRGAAQLGFGHKRIPICLVCTQVAAGDSTLWDERHHLQSRVRSRGECTLRFAAEGLSLRQNSQHILGGHACESGDEVRLGESVHRLCTNRLRSSVNAADFRWCASPSEPILDNA